MGPDRMASALSGPAKPNNKRSSNASSGLIAFRTSTPPNDPWQNISAYLFDAASQNPLANENFRRYFCETCKRCSVKSINARSAGEIHLPLWYSNCDVTEKAGPAQALNGISIEQKKCRDRSNKVTEGGGGVLTCNLCRKVCPNMQGVR